ncbi:hypothetical protein C5E07_14140 [Pseudoclavibacter sp. RFBJ3]|uniref:trypsin-like serine peptidase n=1 Tax=unclassified Pseudoclavibacter TaxID=2615177 RepID=UPI000CE89BE3|nr:MULTISPECIES: hypothetical protein [unclassified Pseudoclavibacter]PPF35664.1 hypothetical protein C5E05_12040 [Pseudoclavibacter sp. AY1H1]PPF73372.1 hypothetical protein C5B99_15475 [Pseudoclavibacter sp. Z016]PPF81418.1 hypothetical protein C5C12_13880 [Pseudoclavibacter sp. RFBJ5]PPF90749.1 hypothetical protein C5E07_14140 [Pseudoclavibacter sp. RFBJ3]PPG00620.1 hypothetical protein C5C19_01590 [Pseudoclavibacter sp. RFBH5]
MTRHRRRPRALLASIGALAAVALLAGCSVSATATPSANGYDAVDAPIEGGTVSLRDSFESSAQESHDFWSDPDMFKNAEGFDYTAPDNGITVGVGDPATGAFVPPTTPVPAAESANGYGDVSEAVPYDRAGLGASTFGRLYMSFASGLAVCSATVVNSGERNIVVTAAHCLVDFESNKAIASNVVFIPGDRGDGAEQPYGRWAATDYSIPQHFLDNANYGDQGVYGEGWNNDFAFLVMEEKDGKRIQDVTGGQGIAFGVPAKAITQVGYPSASPYDGSEEYMCASSQWREGSAGGYTHMCSMTPGGSGGAWLVYYDTAIGAGYVAATSSTVLSSANPPFRWEGSVLGQTALSLYNELGGS